MPDKNAAATLVQTIFDNNESLRNMMAEAKISDSPDAAAEFIKPYFVAMRSMVEKLR